MLRIKNKMLVSNEEPEKNNIKCDDTLNKLATSYFRLILLPKTLVKSLAKKIKFSLNLMLYF